MMYFEKDTIKQQMLLDGANPNICDLILSFDPSNISLAESLIESQNLNPLDYFRGFFNYSISLLDEKSIIFNPKADRQYSSKLRTKYPNIVEYLSRFELVADYKKFVRQAYAFDQNRQSSLFDDQAKFLNFITLQKHANHKPFLSDLYNIMGKAIYSDYIQNDYSLHFVVYERYDILGIKINKTASEAYKTEVDEFNGQISQIQSVLGEDYVQFLAKDVLENYEKFEFQDGFECNKFLIWLCGRYKSDYEDFKHFYDNKTVFINKQILRKHPS